MGALQPGLPSPVMIPENWKLLIINLKDGFFTIPLHPDDAEKFAFTIPEVNKGGPARRYHWVVLPQDMKNSPTICQIFVAWALQPFRTKHKNLSVYHYMDDILIAEEKVELELILRKLQRELNLRGLKIAPENVQKRGPWLYVG